MPCAFEKLNTTAREQVYRYYIVRWQKPVKFDDGVSRQRLTFSISELGDAEARRQAWSYFKLRYRIASTKPARRLSKKTAGETSGMEHEDGEFMYNGKIGVRQFTCCHRYKATNLQFHVAAWTPAVDTFEEPKVFCGNHELVQTN